MINEPHGQPSSNQKESPLDERYDEWKSDDKNEDRKTLRMEDGEEEKSCDTGGKGAYTQRVHCGYIVGSGTIRPPQTQWVSEIGRAHV